LQLLQLIPLLFDDSDGNENGGGVGGGDRQWEADSGSSNRSLTITMTSATTYTIKIFQLLQYDTGSCDDGVVMAAVAVVGVVVV
jgi:hypothetical protein